MREIPTEQDLKRYIVTDRNLDVLKWCIRREAVEFEGLRARKKGLDFGQPLTTERFRSLTPLVEEATREILGVEHIGRARYSIFEQRKAFKSAGKGSLAMLLLIVPAWLNRFPPDVIQVGGSTVVLLLGGAIGYLKYDQNYSGAAYDSNRRMIILGERKTVPVVASISFGYTRHIIHEQSDLVDGKADLVNRNLAWGVSIEVARNFSEREKNPAYIYDNLQTICPFLRDAYIAVCRENGIIPDESIQKLAKKPWFIRFHPGNLFHGRKFALAIAALSIARERQGVSVFRDILNGDYSFLDS